MIASIQIDQHNLDRLIELENEGIAVYAVDKRVHDNILGSRHCSVQSWHFLSDIGDVVDGRSAERFSYTLL